MALLWLTAQRSYSAPGLSRAKLGEVRLKHKLLMEKVAALEAETMSGRVSPSTDEPYDLACVARVLVSRSPR
jgi:hypothetical protein